MIKLKNFVKPSSIPRMFHKFCNAKPADWQYIKEITNDIKQHNPKSAFNKFINSHLNNTILDIQIYNHMYKCLRDHRMPLSYMELLYKLYRNDFKPNLLMYDWMVDLCRSNETKVSELIQSDFSTLGFAMPENVQKYNEQAFEKQLILRQQREKAIMQKKEESKQLAQHIKIKKQIENFSKHKVFNKNSRIQKIFLDKIEEIKNFQEKLKELQRLRQSDTSSENRQRLGLTLHRLQQRLNEEISRIHEIFQENTLILQSQHSQQELQKAPLNRQQALKKMVFDNFQPINQKLLQMLQLNKNQVILHDVQIKFPNQFEDQVDNQSDDYNEQAYETYESKLEDYEEDQNVPYNIYQLLNDATIKIGKIEIIPNIDKL